MGIAWQVGLASALAERGVSLADADSVVGTSAGSVVGAHLRLGTDLSDVDRLLEEALSGPEQVGGGMEGLMAALSQAVMEAGSPQEIRARAGRVAMESSTMPEAEFVGLFSDFAGRSWPPGFSCTAVAAVTGEFVVWDQTSRVPLQTAVAASCAVPGFYPPVTVSGRSYVDGGVRTPLNGDLAAGYDSAIVVSCLMLSLPEGIDDPALRYMESQTSAQLEAVRDSGTRMEVVGPGPEFLELSGWGLYLLDASRVPAALQAGLRQGADEADRLGSVWNDHGGG